MIRLAASRIALALFLCPLPWSMLHAQSVSHLWKSGAGNWDDAERWSNGATFALPDTGSIEGDGDVTFKQGDVSLAQLDVGSFHDAHATLVMEGGMLTPITHLRLGEMTGASAKLIQRGGDIRSIEVFVAGSNVGDGKDRHADGELEVHGGGIVTRHLTLGWGMGSKGRIHIVGSAARPIIVLDYFWVGIRGPQVQMGSDTELAYDIDGEGVTPIVVRNFNASPIALVDAASRSTCRLKVSLLHAPPSGDIVLIRTAKPCNGTFSDLPEGARVQASYGGTTYEWTITYRGGPNHSDVVLIDPCITSPGGERDPVHGPAARNFEVTDEEADSGLRDLITRETAGEKPLDEKAQRAFPGAEGFGAFAKGGRGGRAIYVTNLDDSGPGSFRAAIEAKGPRTILFRVGGVVHLKSALTIREPYVTVAGQTAPGDGICVRADNSINSDTFVLNRTHDVIVRFLRAESGKGNVEARYDDGGDCISIYTSTDFIIDHCSTHFGTDETLSVTDSPDRYTIQWTIIGEGLNYEKHSMASLLGGGRSTWHHNLFVHCGSRNPNFAGEPTCDFRNNVLYDWGHTSGQGGFVRVNYVGNYLRPGPSTRRNPVRFMDGAATVLAGALYLSGNVMDTFPEITRDNTLGVNRTPNAFATQPWPMVAMPADSAETALERVLNGVGATLPKRDAADARVIADVRKGAGKIIESQEEVGGWPKYETATSTVVDSDGDGIPDEWEVAHGLDPHNPNDAQTVTGDGYTWLEKYLNELAAKAEAAAK